MFLFVRKYNLGRCKETVMTFGVVHHFPGGTRENYEASIAAVHPANGLPEGQIFHAAGPSGDGWIIVAVHESQQSWEAFRDDILMPRMQAGIEGGFPTPPEETAFDVTSLLP
jgi:hypothetical protein